MGSDKNCNLDFQNPQFPAKCVDCLLRYRTDLRPIYNSYKHNLCSDTQIINHYCNGGLSPQATADCNALRNGACNLSPDFACTFPTRPPGPATRTPTPPAPVTKKTNPRGCGILYTAGVPSCWCNIGGGQGLCGSLPLNGPGGCRDLCESGTFTGPQGYTHCFMMENNAECRSNDNGTYRFCLNRCLTVNPGMRQSVGCEYPNKTVFGEPVFNLSCVLSHAASNNTSFVKMTEDFFKGLIGYNNLVNYISNLVRVPGLQKTICDPRKEKCNFY